MLKLKRNSDVSCVYCPLIYMPGIKAAMEWSHLLATHHTCLEPPAPLASVCVFSILRDDIITISTSHFSEPLFNHSQSNRFNKHSHLRVKSLVKSNE